MKCCKPLRLITALVVAFILMFSSVLAAEFEKVEGDKECIVYIGSVEVDGEIDEIWEHAPEIPVDVVKNNASLYFGDTSKVAGEDYAKLTCKALWDPDALEIYVLYIVEDKTVTQAASLDWEKDSVELFIDLDNIRAGAKDSNSYQKRIYADENRDGSDDTMISAFKLTDTGYIVELSHILHDDIKPGGYIGIDFQCNDDAEGNGARHVCLGWSDSEDQASKDTKVWGQALLSDINVKDKDKDPGDEDPADTDPGDEDPVDTDPGDEDPADTDPGDEDPADTDPGDEDPADTVPGDEDPVDTKTLVETEPGDEDETPKTFDPGISMLLVALAASLVICFFAKKQYA